MTEAPRSYPTGDLLVFPGGSKQYLLNRVSGSTPKQVWVREHVDYPHKDWCLIWPFPRSNRGDYPSLGSPVIRVHRFMCEYRNGPPPSPTHEAGHSCGRGEDGCVNQWHMIWQTHSENQLQRRQEQSGVNPRYKLTPTQVDEIRALKDRATIADIAAQFGVSENNIKVILAGKIWRTPSNLMKKILTAQEVREIRAIGMSKFAVDLAEQYGVSRSVIDRVRSGRGYKWVDNE